MKTSVWMARALFALGLFAFCDNAFARAPVFETRACLPEAQAAGARCGTVRVPEDHANARGRQIGLNVIVLPATGKERDARRAQYDLEGGPGFAVTDFLEFYAGDGAIYREARDIVLADMRGTGGSNPLRCAAIEAREAAEPAALMYPENLVATCARQLITHSDPSQYTTASAARDIELVRRALGYDKLDLNAISYGTTLALRYIADHPARVSSAVLMGTVPPDRTPPRFHALAAHDSFERLAVDCLAQTECQRTFGDPRQLLRFAQARLPNAALPAPVLLEKLRTLLYSPASRARVPQLLSRAAQGDFSDFTKAGGGRLFADGLYLSITCAESFPNMDVPAALEASRATLFGAYRLERQSAACRHWPVKSAAVPPMPKQSRVPVLFIAGELDPVSPADWAAETAKKLPESRLVRVPRGAHVLDGLTDLDTCLDAVILKFFGGTGDPDTSCFAAMKPPPFEGAR